MTNASTNKIFIQIESEAEQQDHLKTQRKALHVLQSVVSDKENLTGRSAQLDRLSRLKATTDVTLATAEQVKRKKIDTRIAETQTSPEKKAITADDLTSDADPREYYWERLAGKRREALEKTLTENMHLHERINGLEEELDTSRKMLEETRNLVEVLTEMLNDKDEDGDTSDGGVAPLTDSKNEDDDDSVTRSSGGDADDQAEAVQVTEEIQ